MYVDDWSAVLVISAAWMISLTVAVLIYRKSRMIDKKISDLWNMKVELKDLNGETIKVPIPYQKGQDADGNPIIETRMEVAPLWYTIMFAAGNLAVEHFKAWFNNQKSHMAKAFQKNLAGEALAGGEGNEMAAILSIMPKKIVQAYGLYQMLQRGGIMKGGQGSNSPGEQK